MQAALAARNVTHFDAFRVLGERACWSEPPHLPRAIARVNAAAQPNTGGEICKQNARNLQAIFYVHMSDDNPSVVFAIDSVVVTTDL